MRVATFYAFEPETKTQAVLDDEIIRQFNTLNVAREQRLNAVSSSIPAVLWYVVVLGGVLTIMFLLMFHMDFLPQIFLGGITAIFLGVMTFLIYAMDHPLQGRGERRARTLSIGL